ncbi:MAG TPA: ROK family transcriptional regulator [Anaerolineales bacterium]|nr:ROK family transcriptional regulator [Anaerolineales bacterium]
MIKQSTITATEMRGINRSAILEIIRRESPIARTTIARRLGISLPTVMRIADQLIEEGFVQPHGETEWSGGRRRPLLEFNSHDNVVLGVDMGGTKLYGALSEIGGTIIAEAELDRNGAEGEDCYRLLTRLIDDLLNCPDLRGRRVRGIGVGAPGITHHREGIVKWAYALNWKDFPLKERLNKRYKLPITVDNDVNLGALGELWFGVGQDVQNMVLITIGAGIGAGIIVDGALYRGSSEASGEIGHMIPGREYLGKPYAEFGVLESLASATGMMKRIPKNAAAASNPSIEAIFDASRQGHLWARSLLDDASDTLAIAIANLSVLLDPELIVLGGALTPYAGSLVEAVSKRMLGTIPAMPKLRSSNLGLRATVMGAIVTVLHNTSNFYVVHKLS